MTSIDDLRREGRRVVSSPWVRAWPYWLALLMFVAGFLTGVHRGAPSENDQQLVRALASVTDSLTQARHVSDSLRRQDSVVTMAVVAHRPRMDSLSRIVTVSPVSTDSVVHIERPAAVGDSLPRDTTVLVPLALASFVREAEVQLALDTAAFHVKDLRIASLERSDSLAQKQDSLHIEREKGLERERDSAFRRGVWAGVKGTLKGVAVVATAIVVAVVARR